MAIIDDTALRIATRSGFLREYWRMKKSNPAKSDRTIYAELSQIYSDTFGELLFPTFEAFQKAKNSVKRQ